MKRYLPALAVAAVFLSAPNGARADIDANCKPDSDLVPIMATHKLPPWPPLSLFAGEQGTTVIYVVIDDHGNVADDFVDQSSGSKALDDATLGFVKENWKWSPGIKRCAAVSMETRVSVKWDLKYQEGVLPEYPYLAESMAEADYPPAALAKKEEGITGVLVAYSEKGAPLAWWITKSSGYKDLDMAAAQIAMQRHAISPMKLVGQPIKSGVFYAMEWKLKPSPP